MSDEAKVTGESPLPVTILRGLGDRSYDKRKNAALDVEALIRQLADSNDKARLESILHMLGQDFCTSSNSNHRKGGLIALAAAAIGLMQHIKLYLDFLLPPVLHCFDDPESRVRYYACESLYNIAKVSRQAILPHFNAIFEGLCKLFADGDTDVKNGANLFDRLVKDIVTESEEFDVEKFIPILQKFIRRTNPYIRQLLVGWISVLDQVPEIQMLDWLPDFLDGLFHMLSDENRELKQAADKCLQEFLREIRSTSDSVDFGSMVPILVNQCSSKDRLIRLTAVHWIEEFIRLAWERLVPFYSAMLGAVMHCISDNEIDIRQVANQTNQDLLMLVKQTTQSIEYEKVLETLTGELQSHHVPTRLAALRWIYMLLEKWPPEMSAYINQILPALLKTLNDPSDEVALLNLQVLARISLNKSEFQRVLNAIVQLFQDDRKLLEHRGSLIIRQLSVLLNAKSIYMSLAAILASRGDQDLDFVSLMVQTLNLILLTASELAELRTTLKDSFSSDARDDDREVFKALFSCWCHNPVATFSLCLLAQAYNVSAALVDKFAQVEITVGFLMQIDKLVQLLESPIFVLLRLQLLDRNAPNHSELLRSLYGILMILPQSSAYRTLSDRLATVSSHYQVAAAAAPQPSSSSSRQRTSSSSGHTTEFANLLDIFTAVQQRHTRARIADQQKRSLYNPSHVDPPLVTAATTTTAPTRAGNGAGYSAAPSASTTAAAQAQSWSTVGSITQPFRGFLS